MHADGCVEGVVVSSRLWRCGGVDGRPDKDYADL
jgi:hypothetical protein